MSGTGEPVERDFGDFTSDDAVDTARPDPQALARIFLREYRRESGDDAALLYDDLPEREHEILIAVFRRIIDRLERERG